MKKDIGDTEAVQAEYAEATLPDDYYDEQKRVNARYLTDRELLVESVVLLRAFGDALTALGQNPMLKAMMPASFRKQ
jgi:hypothetical protein